MRRYLILENIRSVHNVGACFRSADGAGFDTIFCCGYTPDPSDTRMAKVSLGAENSVLWRRADSALAAIEELKDSGVFIYALERTGSAISLFDTEIADTDFALIVGHEVDGISDPVLAAADQIVALPMLGAKESLNVSVAAGIAMYECLRQTRRFSA